MYTKVHAWTLIGMFHTVSDNASFIIEERKQCTEKEEQHAITLTTGVMTEAMHHMVLNTYCRQ